MIDSTFFDDYCPRSLMLRLRDGNATTELRGGTVIASQVASPLFEGQAVLRQMPHAQAQAAEARLARLMAPGWRVLAYDARRNGPAADPGGVVLGASSPVIDTLDADAKRLRISGLPAGYVLTAGDWIGWTYGSSPLRYAVHQMITGAVADGAGLTPLFEVTPHIRVAATGTPGVAVGAAVVLVRPRAIFRLRSWRPGAQRGPVTLGAQIDLIQTIR